MWMGGRLAGRRRVGRQDDLAHPALVDPPRRARRSAGRRGRLRRSARAPRRARGRGRGTRRVRSIGITSGGSSTTQISDAIAPLVLADPAARTLGEVEADLAQPDPLLDLTDRVGEREGVRVVRAQDVEGEPLGGPLADPGQPGELGDESLDRPRVHDLKLASRPAPTCPGSPSPPSAVPRSRRACSWPAPGPSGSPR